MSKSNITSPVLMAEEKDGMIVKIKFVDGNLYRLEHPGNRVKLQWEKDFYNPATGIDREKLLDLCFEHVVHPDGHTFRPTIDDVKPAHLEVWQKLLRRFLDGELQLDLARASRADA